MKFKAIHPFPGSTSIMVSSEVVALQPSNIPGGTSSRLLACVVCATVLESGRHPLSVKFSPAKIGRTGGGTRLIRKGTPGQLTEPLPLIKTESPHLKNKC